MAESYSTSLRLTLIGDGDLSGTWGDVTNANIGTLLEEAICGVISVPMGDTNYTLQSLNGVKDQARAAVIVATGANTAVRQVIAPLVPKLYILNNSTTGGYNVTIGGSTGSVVTVPAGQSALVYCDGTNFYNGITVAASAATTLGGGAANQILYQASTSNTQFITAPTTANSFLYWTGSSFSWSTISATLTVGVSAISGGTSGYVLYNNGGVLGNSATTGSGTVVLNNSPSFTGTPTFASAPTVGGYSVLTTNTGVSASGNNSFTGTNSFSTAPTVSGYSVVTTNNLSGYASLSGTNTFTGTNTFSSGINTGAVYSTGNTLSLGLSGTPYISFNNVYNTFFPNTDNLMSLGDGGNRWTQVYAVNGTINTSDANEKQQIAELTVSEMAVAKSLKGLMKTFKFNAAVVKKGVNARIHVGIMAQDVQAAFIAQGLDPNKYGVFCSDTLSDGSTRLGVRYDELFAFIIAAL